MDTSRRILFVDDEPLVLQGLQRTMRVMRHQWDMTFVNSGPRGLEALATGAYEVVVSDMRMPGMNGAEFLRLVMAKYPNTIRLVLSGHADQDLVLQCVGVAHQFLTKPCDPEVLKAVIQSTSALEATMGSEEAKRLIGRIDHIPTLPVIYQTIMGLLASDRATVQELGTAISRDIGMTANVLKLTNSAFFGLRHSVSDPREAVSYLGIETLKSLALIHGLYEQIQPFQVAGFTLQHLWNHSLYVANCAKAIGRSEGLDGLEQVACLTGGMLHDVGLLILASKFQKEYKGVIERVIKDRVEIQTAEVEVFGTHHGEVGACLMGLWGLPQPVVQIIALHHTPAMQPFPRFSPIVAVHLAEVYVGEQVGGHDIFRQCHIDHAYLDAIGLRDRLEAWRGLADSILGGAL